ncbi:MAG: DUF1634 domain-containing protein [Desulfurella sp.]|uniref:DUF1634 domain-containing protein n=2 Tax=Desulfurella sp. TaxID=1962857 RepID=UPI00046C9C1D|nr:DUF1634 domain-containing protein [Desulfurella acetivorans]
MKFDLNKFIAKTLAVGVYSSMFLFCVAIIESFFKKSNVLDRSFFGIMNGLIALDPNATLFAGIVILMLTPVVRVLFLAIGYFIEGDLRFCFYSILVLLILIFSVYFGVH